MNSDGLGVVYITLTKSPTPSVRRKQIRRRNEHKRNRGGRSHTSPESMMTMKCSDEGHRNIILPETPCISTLLPRASKVRGGEGRTDRGREGGGILHTEGKRGRKSGRKSARIFCPLPPSLSLPSVRAFARPESRALAPRSPERIRGGGARDSPIVSEGLSGTRTRAEPKSSRGEGAEMLSVCRPTASASPGFHRGRGGETLIILRERERLAERRRPPIPVCCGASNGKVDRRSSLLNT